LDVGKVNPTDKEYHLSQIDETLKYYGDIEKGIAGDKKAHKALNNLYAILFDLKEKISGEQKNIEDLIVDLK